MIARILCLSGGLLLLAACGEISWPMTVSQVNSPFPSADDCGTRSSEAKQRQCRADRTNDDVAVQQSMHDHGMETAQP